MNKIEPIYLSYTLTSTNADGVAPFFQTLDGADGFALVKASASVFNRVATVVHTRARDEAPIEIVCVTDNALDRATADQISQAAVNYAMETGSIPMQGANPQ